MKKKKKINDLNEIPVKCLLLVQQGHLLNSQRASGDLLPTFYNVGHYLEAVALILGFPKCSYVWRLISNVKMLNLYCVACYTV